MADMAASPASWAFVTLGLLISIGFVMGHLAEKLGLPRIATYVVVGAIFSEAFVGRFIPGETRYWDPPLIDAALGLIAFLVGGELEPEQLRGERSWLAGATAGQSAGSLVLVSGVLWFYLGWQQVPAAGLLALVLGIVSTLTGPAVTIAILEEYRARGQLTNLLLGVVVAGDAAGILLFTMFISFTGHSHLSDTLSAAGWQIIGALVVGAILGGALGWFGRRVHSEDLRLPVIVGSVLLALGISEHWQFSMLLSCMTLGIVSKRLFGGKTGPWLSPMQHIQEVVFLVLFTLAGTHFQPHMFLRTLPLIALYALARVVGKYAGAWAGTSLTKAVPEIRRNLGMTLLPQGGVAIGLALVAARTAPLEQAADLIVNVVLGSTILFEIAAPLLTKLALSRAGERRT